MTCEQKAATGRLTFALVLHLPDIAWRSSSELRNTLQGSSPIAGKVHGRTCEKYVQRFDSRLPSGPSPSVISTPLTLRSTSSSLRSSMWRMPSKHPPFSWSLSVQAGWKRALSTARPFRAVFVFLAMEPGRAIWFLQGFDRASVVGVQNASRELSFDLCYQKFHQMSLRSSPMSSRGKLPRLPARTRDPGGTQSRPHNGHESHKTGTPYVILNTKKLLHHPIPEARPRVETCAGLEGGSTRWSWRPWTRSPR